MCDFEINNHATDRNISVIARRFILNYIGPCSFDKRESLSNMGELKRALYI